MDKHIHTLICSVIRLILVIHAPGPFFVFGKKKLLSPVALCVDKTRLSLARRRVLRCNNGQLCRRCECVWRLKCVQLVNNIIFNIHIPIPSCIHTHRAPCQI